MLCLYSGTPGSGKSLHAARLIRDRLRYAKKPVICNFDVSPDLPNYSELFHYVPNHELTPSFLRDFAASYWDGSRIKEDSIVIIVDEAQLLFNTRNWSDKNRFDWIEFLSQHRHYGYFIVFIAQVDKMIDRQIRALVEYEYKHRKIAHLGRIGQFLKVLMLGRELFVCVQTYHGMRNCKISSYFFMGSKKLYAVYDSYSTFARAPSGAEEGATGSPPMRATGRARTW